MLSLIGHCAPAVLVNAMPKRSDIAYPLIFILSHFDFHLQITHSISEKQSPNVGISSSSYRSKFLKRKNEYPFMVIIDSQKNRIFADRTVANGFCSRHFLAIHARTWRQKLVCTTPLPVPPDGATRTQRQLGHRRLTLRRLIGIRTTIRPLTIWESIIQGKTK